MTVIEIIRHGITWYDLHWNLLTARGIRDRLRDCVTGQRLTFPTRPTTINENVNDISGRSSQSTKLWWQRPLVRCQCATPPTCHGPSRNTFISLRRVHSVMRSEEGFHWSDPQAISSSRSKEFWFFWGLFVGLCQLVFLVFPVKWIKWLNGQKK